MSFPNTIDNQGPDTHDGHDWEGFPGGCQRMGCSPDCARQEIARLRAQLEPKSVQELIQHRALKSLSEKQINDVLVKLHQQLTEANAKLASGPVALPGRMRAIGAIVEAQLSIKDCITGTTNWASRIYDAVVSAATTQGKTEAEHGQGN